MRGHFPVFLLLAALSLPGYAQEGPTPGASIPRERAKGDIPEGFEPVDLPDLGRVQRERAQRIDRQAEIQPDLLRRETFRTVNRTGRATWGLWSDW